MTGPALVCPECGEPAQARPPTSWTPAWGPAPAHSHTDGEPLCPVVGPTGYQPATPVHPDGTPLDSNDTDHPGNQR